MPSTNVIARKTFAFAILHLCNYMRKVYTEQVNNCKPCYQIMIVTLGTTKEKKE
jgi:hypothetical protein